MTRSRQCWLGAIGSLDGLWRRRTAAQEGVIAALVDGGSVGLRAVDWAALEASARGVPLRVVHAIGHSLDASAVDGASTVVDAACARARAVAADLRVITDVQAGTSPLLCGLEELIVVGRRGRRTGLVRTGADGPSAGRVVVGVDDRLTSPAALGFAYRAARHRGLGLTVVQSVSRGDDVLRLLASAFPDVDVRRSCVPMPTGRALVDEAVGAELVVVGTRGRRRAHHAVCCSFTNKLLRSARGPMAIVPTLRAD